MSSLPRFGLISIGVNCTPGARTLRYAERDATGITCAFAGQLGPVHPGRANVLLGVHANSRDLDEALDQEAARRPEYLVLYFGGHGNRTGIGLSDGIYPFTRLRERLAAIGALGTVVMLNSCEAGGFAKSATVSGLGDVRDLATAWSVLLLTSLPGTRVFMASAADASTFELPTIGGVYAHALINAMQAPLPGDLSFMGYEFVSDRLVFARAARIMRQYGLTPRAGGTFGRFPMVISNHLPVGDTEVASISAVEGAGIEVVVDVRDRFLLPTKIVATASDSFGNRWPAETAVTLPEGEHRLLTARFNVEVGRSRGALHQLANRGSCRVTWDIAVVDANGRLLAQGRRIAHYYP